MQKINIHIQNEFHFNLLSRKSWAVSCNLVSFFAVVISLNYTKKYQPSTWVLQGVVWGTVWSLSLKKECSLRISFSLYPSCHHSVARDRFKVMMFCKDYPYFFLRCFVCSHWIFFLCKNSNFNVAPKYKFLFNICCLLKRSYSVIKCCRIIFKMYFI